MILSPKTWMYFCHLVVTVHYLALALEGKFYVARELVLATSTPVMPGDGLPKTPNTATCSSTKHLINGSCKPDVL